ncbi:MAG: hypothetical protein FWF88_01765 [Peptococcaceae bacterium]|nr:hypothetical protein [Peptococcaceae bacterium]
MENFLENLENGLRQVNIIYFQFLSLPSGQWTRLISFSLWTNGQWDNPVNIADADNYDAAVVIVFGALSSLFVFALPVLLYVPK